METSGGAQGPSLNQQLQNFSHRRLKSFSYGSKNCTRGWLQKNLGKNKAGPSYFFELDETNDAVSCYSDHIDSRLQNFHDFIRLEGAQIKYDPKKNLNRFAFTLREKSGKRHYFQANSPEDLDTWRAAFQKSIDFYERSLQTIAKMEPIEDYTSKFKAKQNDFEMIQKKIVQISNPEEFWSYDLQDLAGSNKSIQEIVGPRITLVILLRNYGSIISRTAAQRILALKDDFQELGLQIAIIGAGSAPIAKNIFIKEQRVPSGVYVYCDQKQGAYKIFNEEFGKNSKEISTQMYGVFVLNQYGAIYSWFGKELEDQVDPFEIWNSVKLFYFIHSNECWSQIKLPKRDWSALKGLPDENCKNLIIDRNTGYEYEYGVKNPPLGPIDLIDDLLPYTECFYQTEHIIFIGEDEDVGPMVVCLEDSPQVRGISRRGIIIHKKSISKITVPLDQCETVKDALRYMINQAFKKPLEKVKLIQVDDQEIRDDVLHLEKQIFFKQYKFGILYAKTGQIEEDKMYLATDTSQDFQDFLGWIGEKIKLTGWTKFRGGLDARGSECTGSHSYFTNFQDQEIMFHVSTMMPVKENDPSRKRYVGNDVVVIIFKDTNDTDKFNPHIIRSQFNHIFAVVEKVSTPQGPGYRIEMAQKPSVPPYQPFIPDPPIFPINIESRSWFLTKLINAERATISNATMFRTNMATTREALLGELVKKHSTKKPRGMRQNNTLLNTPNSRPVGANRRKEGFFTRSALKSATRKMKTSYQSIVDVPHKLAEILNTDRDEEAATNRDYLLLDLVEIREYLTNQQEEWDSKANQSPRSKQEYIDVIKADLDEIVQHLEFTVNDLQLSEQDRQSFLSLLKTINSEADSLKSSDMDSTVKKIIDNFSMIEKILELTTKTKEERKKVSQNQRRLSQQATQLTGWDNNSDNKEESLYQQEIRKGRNSVRGRPPDKLNSPRHTPEVPRLKFSHDTNTNEPTTPNILSDKIFERPRTFSSPPVVLLNNTKEADCSKTDPHDESLTSRDDLDKIKSPTVGMIAVGMMRRAKETLTTSSNRAAKSPRKSPDVTKRHNRILSTGHVQEKSSFETDDLLASPSTNRPKRGLSSSTPKMESPGDDYIVANTNISNPKLSSKNWHKKSKKPKKEKNEKDKNKDE